MFIIRFLKQNEFFVWLALYVLLFALNIVSVVPKSWYYAGICLLNVWTLGRWVQPHHPFYVKTILWAIIGITALLSGLNFYIA